MRRRELLALAASLAAGGSRANEPSRTLVGYLGVGSPSASDAVTALRRGLAEAGYAEGRDLVIEARWAEGRYERLPALASELVRLRPALIVATGGSAPALAVKEATASIPIVFAVTDDPVSLGLVASLARPGGNATGVHLYLSDLAAKQLGLLRELLPRARRFGLLVNPRNANAEPLKREIEAAATGLGLQADVVPASDIVEIEAAFASLAERGSQALVVGADPFFFGSRSRLTALAARHALPTAYNVREFAETGGLLAYGASLAEMHRQVAAYAARILRGARPADLPVALPTRFELVINAKAAKALGLDIPPALLARADEVIE